MANNRLVMVNPATGLGIFVAKHLGTGWHDVDDRLPVRVNLLFRKLEKKWQAGEITFEQLEDIRLYQEHQYRAFKGSEDGLYQFELR